MQHRETAPPIPRASLLWLLAALLLSSALSVTIWMGRVLYANNYGYIFMLWNLFLAWIPFWSAVALSRISSLRWYAIPFAVLAFGCWLFFLPNAPYLVTDLIHLGHDRRVPIWYDAIMLFSFAWNGLLLGFVSVWIVQKVIVKWFGPIMGWLTVAGSLAASGFGVYLGRFLRWNSWDVVTNPEPLLIDIAERLLNPLSHPRTYGVSILFAALMFLGYLTVMALIQAEKATERSQ